MSKLLVSIAGCVLVTGALVAGDKAPGAAHASFADVDHWVKVFEDPARREWQKPVEVLEYLGIAEGEVVADIGAGTGYFTGLLTAEVGPLGKVYAVELEQGMLDYIAKRYDVQPDRVAYVLAEPDDPKLPPGGTDLILMVDTWHHIANRSKYLRKLAVALSPGGRVVIVDFREGELPVGPPPAEKLSRGAVVAEYEKGGFQLVAESVMLPYQYLLTFSRPRK